MDDVSRRQDYEANLFAMALLMPEHMIREQLKKFEGVNYENTIQGMAKLFQVTPERMAARLTVLKITF